jgi:hypothetical protein
MINIVLAGMATSVVVVIVLNVVVVCIVIADADINGITVNAERPQIGSELSHVTKQQWLLQLLGVVAHFRVLESISIDDFWLLHYVGKQAWPDGPQTPRQSSARLRLKMSTRHWGMERLHRLAVTVQRLLNAEKRVAGPPGLRLEDTGEGT